MILPQKAEWPSILLLAICSACTTLAVNTEHDPSTDFSLYRTFSFADPADIGEERTTEEALLRERIEPAISQQLVAKGLRRIGGDQHPDLSVYYWVNVKETQKKAWRSGYSSGANYSGTYAYREGTLIVDLVETIKTQLIWRATIMAPLKDVRTRNMDLAVKAVEQAFLEYPPPTHSP